MNWSERARRLVFDREGPLTRELVRQPGGFGLGQVPTRLAPDATTTMVCGFCSTGCGLDVHLRDGEAINLSPSTRYPVNLGMACPKGWEALTPLRAPDRATSPMIRERGALVPTDWSTAAATFASRFQALQREHGPDSVAFLSTGQIASEEMALLGAVAKFGMGFRHGDGNTRQCMATAVTAYKQSFGFDAPPFTYADFEESDVLIFVGANPCIAHPILWERVCKNRRDPRVVVIDPRRTETAQAASLHLPLSPKSDLALFYGLAHLLFERGLWDPEFCALHTSGVEELRAHVAPFTLEATVEATGLSAATINELVALIGSGKRVSFWWTMGVNQSHEGVKVAQSLINLALMTGNIGRPGTGANSITGQCNAMGSRLFSNTSSLFGGRSFSDEGDRADVARILGVDAASIPTDTGLAYDQIMAGIHAGTIRGLWVIGTNTAHSWINQADCHALLSKLDFLVVQDMYADTETAAFAHLVLPAAGWGEKEGTFINSERRLGVIKRVARAPGQALADFHILHLLAEAWGCSDMFEKWTTPEAVFGLLKELSRGRPCDITGIEGYAELDRVGGAQWPCTRAPEAREERRLFEDGRFFHADGRARFAFAAPRPLPESTDARYPLLLLTGRGSSSQWHTQTRTRRSGVLRALSPAEPYVEVSPADAKRFGVSPGQLVRVRSKRGSMRARAFVTHAVQPGQVFVPMHYREANQLTFAAFDPESRQPAYKACAVTIEYESEEA